MIDDASAPFFTIGQVADLLGVSPAALRRLEEYDLVAPERSRGGQRRYSQNDVARLREVMALAEEGVSPAAARKVLDLREQVEALESELADLRFRQS